MNLAHISQRIVTKFISSWQAVTYNCFSFVEVILEVVGSVDDGSFIDGQRDVL